MKIIVAGASGFLGTALRRQLESAGHETVQLVRTPTPGPGQVRWDPARGELDPATLDSADAVVNLGGAPIARWPWTSTYKQTILKSRLDTTGTIARTIAGLDSPPALINAGGINYYGDRGDELLDEDAGPGNGFIAEVSRQWDEAPQVAADAGARVVRVRTSVVLHKTGGSLKPILIPFRLGAGGKLGDGRQFFPTISLTDYVAAVSRLIADPTLAGPFNLVAPAVATNAEFTEALGRALHRPTVIRAPRFAIKAVAGGELSTLALGSVNAVPRRLMDAGFEFQHPTISAQLDAALRD
ncbi:MAG: TIGR01777 family protein [Propionibacteriales bacterium]|nr:TIGR01777 family protein [Propionibacteriales bacterium]